VGILLNEKGKEDENEDEDEDEKDSILRKAGFKFYLKDHIIKINFNF
jgi:hypothetical protein